MSNAPRKFRVWTIPDAPEDSWMVYPHRNDPGTPPNSDAEFTYDLVFNDDGWSLVHETQGGHTFETAGSDTRGELMQYTGLDDAEGTPIYEEDVVDFDSWIGVVTIGEFTCDVRGAGTMRFKGIHLRGVSKGNVYPVSVDEIGKMTVIGNKFENPALLEEVTA